MRLQLKLLLGFNAMMFAIAGLLEWRYYIAHSSGSYNAPGAQLSRQIASEQQPVLNLEELHKSFRNKLQNSSVDTISHGLVAQPHTHRPAAKSIRGDGSGHELTNAAVVLICYNRYMTTHYKSC